MRNYHLFFLLVIVNLCAQAQDTLYFKNREKVTIVLLEVNPENIKYKRFDNQGGAIYTILKNEIDYITLSNGKKEIFAKGPAAADSAQVKTPTLSPSPANNPAASSDSLIFRSGKRLAVKIYELTPTEARYKLIANLDGPVYKINKSELSEIIFSTGLKQKISADSPPANYNTGLYNANSSLMAIRGANDARVYYRNKGGSMATGILSAIFPPAGLIPAFICINTRPKDHNLGYPDENLWANRDYKLSYSNEAYRMKKKRVWTGFGIGTGIFILLLFVPR